jgi:hypothetical protein
VHLTRNFGGGLLSPLPTSFLAYNAAQSRLESNVDLTSIASGEYIAEVRGELPSGQFASTQFNLRLIKCTEAIITANVVGQKTSYSFDMTVEGVPLSIRYPVFVSNIPLCTLRYHVRNGQN